MDKKCKKNEKFEMEGCHRKVHEDAIVTVPVTVRAFAEVGDVDIRCAGPAVIHPNSTETRGVPRDVLYFTVSQRLHVDIPLKFFETCEVGEECVFYEPVEVGRSSAGIGALENEDRNGSEERRDNDDRKGREERRDNDDRKDREDRRDNDDRKDREDRRDRESRPDRQSRLDRTDKNRPCGCQ